MSATDERRRPRVIGADAAHVTGSDVIGWALAERRVSIIALQSTAERAVSVDVGARHAAVDWLRQCRTLELCSHTISDYSLSNDIKEADQRTAWHSIHDTASRLV